MISKFNELAIDIKEKTNIYKKSEKKYEELFNEKYNCEKESKPFLKWKDLEIADSHYNKHNNELDQLLLDWQSLYNLIEQCKVVQEKQIKENSNKFNLITNAVNSINTYIANNIAKRKSKEWETKGYKRNFDLPQTAISMIFFNNILKIGDKGFEQVPKISTLNDNFIRHIDEINFNETHYSNKIEYEIGFELLNTLSTLIQEQYSFGEIIDLLNSEFTKENKIMKQLDDFEILEKLKKLKK